MYNCVYSKHPFQPTACMDDKSQHQETSLPESQQVMGGLMWLDWCATFNNLTEEYDLVEFTKNMSSVEKLMRQGMQCISWNLASIPDNRVWGDAII